MVTTGKKEPLRVVLVGFHPQYLASFAWAFREIYGTAGVALEQFSHFGSPLHTVNLTKPDVIIVWPEQIGTTGENVMRMFLGATSHKDRATFIGTYDDQIAGCEKSRWRDFLTDARVRLESVSSGNDYRAIARSVGSGASAQMA